MTGATKMACDVVVPARATSSFDQHQREMRTGWGNPWGSCAPLLVADYQPQDRLSLPPARAGFLSMTLTSLNWRGLNCAPSFSRNSHWSHCPSPGVRTNCGVSPRALPRILHHGGADVRI